MLYNIKSDEGDFYIETNADEYTIRTLLDLLKRSDVNIKKYNTLIESLISLGYMSTSHIGIKIIND